ncbi:cyclic lactone autoinducer peptide [Paenibacillus antri]|uniref:Cyclic lactone autoinducer peptide n=1 Tax=Paenibacillus antri TaxID=2582848 RepID=A0A5R9GAT2_9BACL|nr:cyclic lactone autoinducer peptide [Paenibacillus antri]TLS50498.1 cyclic lactone autoinducer peptide [Paenibacillus antri]
MKHRIALAANAVLAAIATVVMTSASSWLLYRPEIPAELQRKQ